MHCHTVITSLDRSGVGGTISIRGSNWFLRSGGILYPNLTGICTTEDDTMSSLQVAWNYMYYFISMATRWLTRSVIFIPQHCLKTVIQERIIQDGIT